MVVRLAADDFPTSSTEHFLNLTRKSHVIEVGEIRIWRAFGIVLLRYQSSELRFTTDPSPEVSEPEKDSSSLKFKSIQVKSVSCVSSSESNCSHLNHGEEKTRRRSVINRLRCLGFLRLCDYRAIEHKKSSHSFRNANQTLLRNRDVCLMNEV